MEYIFSHSQPASRFVSIELHIEGPFGENGFDLQLPSWRPGRYELGNFAKNIRSFHVTSGDGKQLAFKKITKDRWHISGPAQSVQINYEYYAAQPDAGACYADHQLLYINPVHCCFYIPGRENENIKVRLNVPDDWKVATGMPKTGDHRLEAKNFDQLADCPFMASPSISHAQYTLDDIDFNIWIQGDSAPDWPVMVKDFTAFSEVQLAMMKEFPAKDYHFLVLLLPYAFYHGVEHLNSTVLALGPGYKLMQPAMYKELLGVASHELFHSWNIKSIRPAEMLPYNYASENYATTGYVYEGITTYYGDLFLARSGYFNLKSLLEEFSVRLQRHMDNAGRFNYSVAESSFDTWLDGYTPGVPGRKTSIYDEGCLLALILDFMIRSATESKKSLNDVMRNLYFDFARKNRGYTADSFRECAEQVAGRSFREFFDNYIYKATSLDSLLGEVVSLAGLNLVSTPSLLLQERYLGMRTENRNGQAIVSAVYPGSPADQAGLFKDDELISINGIRIENNLSELISLFQNTAKEWIISSGRKIRIIPMHCSEINFYSKHAFESEESLSQSQLNFRQQWITG